MGILARNTSDDAFDVTRTADADAVARPARTPAASGVRLAAPLQLRDASRYELLGEHGRGGLGRILRAHDNELGRDIAIKELLERNHNSEVRFFREALITARLEHPNIVPVHEAGRWADGTPFYAMKLVSGRPLKQLIEDAETLGDRLALLPNIIAVADAIAYAHDNRVLHRDLKPSNVLVGNFGETVVIDWGLAKVLDEPEAITDAPYRKPAREELTVTGTMLGTPAYMAPEQAIGTSNERTDIYALGGMLCEVLTGKLPNTSPTYPPGTPRDLIAVAQRAMAINPEQRYARALDLATDLRRFARRERVSARAYSIPARFALGVSRHKTFAVMLVAGLVALTITLGISLAKIADQRTEAVVARNDADLARRNAEAAKDALTLKHVELLMHTDPTAALAALGDYHGLDETRRRQLEAEARGRGVAREVLTPHVAAVLFTIRDADGGLVSLGEDHRLQRTTAGKTTTLAGNVANNARWAHSPARGLLAYAVTPGGIDLLDLRTRAITQLVPTGAPESLAFSPDGTQLAVVDHDGTVCVWNLTPAASIARREAVTDPVALAFAGPNHVVVWRTGGLVAIDLAHPASHAAPHVEGAFDHDPLEHPRMDASAEYVVFGGLDGTVRVYSPDLAALASLHLCSGGVRAVHLIDGGRFVFGCRDGEAGIARYVAASGTVAVEHHLKFPGTIQVFAVDANATLIAAASDATLYVHDTRSSMTWSREGQASMIIAISLPTAQSDAIATADIVGTVRFWDPPAPVARVLADLPTTMFGVIFSPDGSELEAYGTEGPVMRLGLDGRSHGQLTGHTGLVQVVLFDPTGDTLTTGSWDGTARVWRRSDGKPLRVFSGHHAVVQDFGYLDHDRIVSAGNDGTLRRWSISGEDDVVVFRRPMPLEQAEVFPALHQVAVRDESGAVWRVDLEGGGAQLLHAATDPASFVRSSPDLALLAVGTHGGEVAIYRTTDWTVVARGTASAEIQTVQIDPRNREALAISADGHVHVIPISGPPRLAWHEMAVGVVDVRYAPDGNTLEVATHNGGIWLFRTADSTWAYVRDHVRDQRHGRFSPDGKWLVTTDGDGSVVIRDIAATFTTH